jgi:hypothetical protein
MAAACFRPGEACAEAETGSLSARERDDLRRVLGGRPLLLRGLHNLAVASTFRGPSKLPP